MEYAHWYSSKTFYRLYNVFGTAVAKNTIFLHPNDRAQATDPPTPVHKYYIKRSVEMSMYALLIVARKRGVRVCTFSTKA